MKLAVGQFFILAVISLTPGIVTSNVLSAADKRPLAGTPWWSFRPLVRPAVPSPKDRSWGRTPIDAFVLSVLEAKGMKPSAPADKATLLRRLSFDLLGLPPTSEEIDAFERDTAPDAYERLVDRLLASPHYGERWGRHWLDVVHYGDTHGYDKDKRRNHAWPYRDYVIRAFNEDKPYGRFIQEQLAGDILFPNDPQAPVATGFIAAGPWDFVGHVELREGTIDKAKARLLDRDDMVATTISTFCSLTAHCARCHDHKFDPIPQQDYYSLQAVFAGVERGDRFYGDLSIPARRQPIETRLQKLRAERDAMRKADSPKADAAKLNKIDAESAELDRTLRTLPEPQAVYAAKSIAPRPIHRLQRGEVEQPREPAGPGALGLLPGLNANWKLANPNDEGGRRAALAHWLSDPGNVLTWRSIVNRVWHYHFGRGLVDTPNDFGRNGAVPSHPELLDWLAVECRDHGQSLKHLHRLIVNSATYRQSSDHHATYAKLDGDNRYLWRMNRQRLDAESLRDAVLAVSGTLDRRLGGPGYDLFRFKDDHSPIYDHSAPEKVDDPATRRRTVYRFVVRSVPNPFMESLDCADPNIQTPVRNTTLTALQALALLNDPFMVKQAEYFAARLDATGVSLPGKIDLAYRLALGRPPNAEERAAMVHYADQHGLVNACRVLFNANEFVFVD